MKTNKFDSITLTIDSANGARIIIGLKNNGKAHSGAFSTKESQPLVHQKEFELEPEIFKKIMSQFEYCNPFSLEDSYFEESENQTELETSLKNQHKKITISSHNPDNPKLPEKLKKFINLLTNLSKW